PKTKCKTAYCFTKCVPEIKADILAKLGSTSFSIVTNLGSYIVSSQFCGFDQIVSGKRDTSKRIFPHNDNTVFKYEEIDFNGL
ncbi:unnamed protein product, partial [Adineta steineri]